MRAIRDRTRERDRERRQSGRLTRRELRQSLSGSGRKWLGEVWEAAEEYSLRLSRLSPVTSPLGTELTDEYMAERKIADEGLHRALFLTLVAGYAARTVLAGPTEQPGLEAPVPRADWVRAIATEKFDSVMTLPPEVWRGYVATATMKQQRRLTSPTLPWHWLGRERIETLLRYGYVLRCVDEALDSEPVLQDQ
jgi:hypothetical protein